jgi:EF hand
VEHVTAKHRPARRVETTMKPRLHVLLLTSSSFLGWFAIDGFQGAAEQAHAQPPTEASRSDSGDRNRDRGRFGDRSSRDWRSSRSRRDDDRRGDDKRDERSSNSDSPSTTSGSTSDSSRSTSSSSPAPSTSTPATSSGASPSLDLKKWATALVAKNDKNGNMILEPDEQGGLGSSAAGDDLNRDGKITIDEIVMHRSGGTIAAGSPAIGGPSTASNNSAPAQSSGSRPKIDEAMAKRVLTGTAGGTGKDADKRHSYRFSRATDKLPTGLPSWFKSRDRNSDGQVSMSEFSRSVSASMVAEFRRYDANDDGMITAKEAAKQK